MTKKNAQDMAPRYLNSLRAHLCSRRLGGSAARGIGRSALASGLQTLDLARIHEGALATLTLSHDFSGPRSARTEIPLAGGGA